MILDFASMPTQQLEHFKGGEKSLFAEMYADEHNRILHGRMIPGCSIGLHTHADSSEIIYCIEGVATLICDGVKETLHPGQCHYCPPGHAHTMRNDTDRDAVFFAVVPQHG